MNIFDPDFDLETELQNDKEGNVLEAVQKQLEQAQQQLVSQINRGLAPNDFSAATSLKEAVEAARTLVQLSQFFKEILRHNVILLDFLTSF